MDLENEGFLRFPTLFDLSNGGVEPVKGSLSKRANESWVRRCHDQSSADVVTDGELSTF